AKAKLLLRYGLQMETPNPQNILIQLDRDLKPTGKIIFRDVSDTFFVKAVAKGLGYRDIMIEDMKHEYYPNVALKPYWSNSSWRLNKSKNRPIYGFQLEAWGLTHDKAYVHTILSELGLPLDSIEVKAPRDTMFDLYDLLDSQEGQKAL